MSKQNELFSRKSIKSALKVWDDPAKLGKLPLGKMVTPTGDGYALRGVLREGIKRLKPDGEPAYPLTRPWQRYIILTEQYMKGTKRQAIQDRWGIPKTTYTGLQGEALDRLGGEVRKLSLSRPDPFRLVPPPPANPLIAREQLLEKLKGRLSFGDTVALHALENKPGVGTSRLAIALAHDQEVVRARFCDGILWARLGRQPDVLELLSGWGMAVGLSESEINQFSTIKQRMQAIQGAIGTQRMLLVIDDAWQTEAASCFKLGGPNCAQLLTTRSSQIAWRFAGWRGLMAVPELNEESGVALLAHFVPQLVKRQPQNARALVQAVGGLPLALTLMGDYLRQSGRLPAALQEFQQVKQRLQVLRDLWPHKQPDLPLSLLASLEIRINALDEAARQALLALSRSPSQSNRFSKERAFAVVEESAKIVGKLRQARVLTRLTQAGLLTRSAAESYTLPQSIADYASLLPHVGAAQKERVTEQRRSHSSERLQGAFRRSPALVPLPA